MKNEEVKAYLERRIKENKEMVEDRSKARPKGELKWKSDL